MALLDGRLGAIWFLELISLSGLMFLNGSSSCSPRLRPKWAALGRAGTKPKPNQNKNPNHLALGKKLKVTNPNIARNQSNVWRPGTAECPHLQVVMATIIGSNERLKERKWEERKKSEQNGGDRLRKPLSEHRNQQILATKSTKQRRCSRGSVLCFFLRTSWHG